MLSIPDWTLIGDKDNSGVVVRFPGNGAIRSGILLLFVVCTVKSSLFLLHDRYEPNVLGFPGSDRGGPGVSRRTRWMLLYKE